MLSSALHLIEVFLNAPSSFLTGTVALHLLGESHVFRNAHLLHSFPSSVGTDKRIEKVVGTFKSISKAFTVSSRSIASWKRTGSAGSFAQVMPARKIEEYVVNAELTLEDWSQLKVEACSFVGAVSTASWKSAVAWENSPSAKWASPRRK